MNLAWPDQSWSGPTWPDLAYLRSGQGPTWPNGRDATGKISDFCVACRKALRRIWNVPYNTHCELLYCLCNDLPVYGEICKRSLRFIAACLSHHCDLVRFFAWHVCAPGTSLIGRNMITCSARYSFKICDAPAGCVDFDDAGKRYRCGMINDECMKAANFLRDLIDNRDYYVRCLLTRDELCDIIKFVTVG